MKTIVDVIKKLDDLVTEMSKALARGDFELAEKINEEYCMLEEKHDLMDRMFEQDGKVGLKDVLGKILVPPIYCGFTELYSYTIKRGEPVVAVDECGKKALVTTDGEGTPVTPFAYNFITVMECTGYYVCVKIADGKVSMGLLSSTGAEVVPCEMDTIYACVNGYIPFEKCGKYGVLTPDGVCVAPIYDDMRCDENWMIRVVSGARNGYIDAAGVLVDDKTNVATVGLRPISVLDDIMSFQY